MATSRNPHTGDKIQSKPADEAYRNNYDAIFGKKDTPVLNKYLVWSDGTVRPVEPAPFPWLSGDFVTVIAYSEKEALESAAARGLL